MTRLLRMVLVVLLATSVLVAIPGGATATVPGDNGRIVFVSDADDSLGEIYVRDVSGNQPVRLTNNSDRDALPVWSPDGTQIAFSRAGGTVGDVFVMDPDGTNVINLTMGVGSSNSPFGWSPDGSKIIFDSYRGGQDDLWVMNADGSNPQRLTNTPEFEWDAAWSPDGSTIVFSQTVGASLDLLLMDSDGSNVRNLATGPLSENGPSWSPDGSKIVFSRGLASDVDIWVVDANGSNPVNLTQSLSNDYGPAWSPDGTRIAFTSNRDGDADLWTMNVDGSGAAHLTDRPGSEWDVDWESVNRVPKTVNDEAFTYRGRSVEVDPLSNDSDPDGEVLTLADITRMPDEGTVSIGPLGTVTYTHNGMTVPSNHVMPYTDSFDYRVDDARLGSATGTVQIWIYPYFDDVPLSNVFFDDVVWLALQRITQGCNPPDNTLFCPTEFVTRGQMAAFLVRARGYADGGGDDLFLDDNGSIFELDIDRLGTAGVTRGCNPPVNDRFCPDGLVTRGQMGAFLARSFSLTDQGRHDLFVDDNGSIFEADIDKLGATGVSKGCNPPVNDRFCPDEYVTRAQMAAFISRAVSWGQE